jgi:two-component system secretion response regulator SsrB
MSSTEASQDKVTLYVAEDHVGIRELLVRFLGSIPKYEVVGQMTDGRLVAGDCRRLKPKVLILDLDLPGLDGIEIAGLIRDQCPDTKILVFSGMTDSATVRQALEAGVHGIIEKTASIDLLEKAINAVAAGEPFYGDAITKVMHDLVIDSGTIQSQSGLSPREQQVLRLVAEGNSNREVATQLGISLKTAENHRHKIMRKLNAHNGADLTREAFRLGILRSRSSRSGGDG